MRYRSALVGLLLVGLTLGLSTSVPAQTSPVRRAIEVTLVSFKFEPSEIRVTEGETVTIRLRNADQQGRPHSFASRYLLPIPLTVRGDGRQGVEEERKFVLVEAGKQAEFEFVAQNRGSYGFICSVLIHSVAGMTGAIHVQLAGSR
jgi:uncharacterized cupredoxin-like copper-binding protein